MMHWALMGIGCFGLLVSLHWRREIDSCVAEFVIRCRDFFRPHRTEHFPELPAITKLLAEIRSGHSLETALEKTSKQKEITPLVQRRLQKVLELAPENDVLSLLLHQALLSGLPVEQNLCFLKQTLLLEKRFRLRSESASSQSRTQASVLSWLPILLTIVVAFLDPKWFFSALATPMSWLFWITTLLLTRVGQIWIQRQVRLSTKPQSEADKTEEEVLPDILLSLMAAVSSGKEIYSSLEFSLIHCPNEKVKSYLLFDQEISPIPDALARLRLSLRASQESGAPIRDELFSQLKENLAVRESRMEERVGALPTRLLAPLFLCYLPSSLLTMSGFLLPLFGELL